MNCPCTPECAPIILHLDVATSGAALDSNLHADVLWDSYAVPHIFAPESASLFHAMAWAQMRNHGNLILRLYGQARGRAAEYWGSPYLVSDRWAALMSIPERARDWYGAQCLVFRGYLEAFAAGINDFAASHPDRLSEAAKAVLPVDAVDVLAHCQRVVNFSFVVDQDSIANLTKYVPRCGSNAWAIGPSRSADGHAMLLTNPHMPWADIFLCFEAHLNAPGINAYGIALVGFPVLAMAFNEYLGWSHTVNTYTGWTLYELEPARDGYRLDGEVRAFQNYEKILKVKQRDGSLLEEPFTARHSLHGPVVDTGGRTFALRVAGLDQPRALEQWWNMARATNLAEFEKSVEGLQLPMFTVIYADRDGHIMHLFNGRVPVPPPGVAEWGCTMPGNVSATIWTETHTYRDLPRVVDPASGWVQNANDPPYTTTFPRALHPDDYPPYMSPRGPMSLRAQRSARAIMEHDKLSLEDLVKLKYATDVELATRVLDELIRAARLEGRPRVCAAADVLAAWDRKADPDSRGAVLFVLWAQTMDPDQLFAIPWDEGDPLSTPRGLADPSIAVATLEQVAETVESTYGALDVAWGQVFQLRSSRVTLPAVGADKVGVFPELWFLPTKDGHFAAVGGDCYTAAVEFSTPVRAMVLTVYGNASQSDSDVGDEQLKLFARKQLRPAWLTRTEIMDHLASHEIVPGSASLPK